MTADPQPVPAKSVGEVSTFDPDRTAPQAISAAVDLPPGYEYLGTLGRGGMGVVYLARHLGLNRTVALKMILAGGHADPADVARFRTEAEALARLDHPNAVKLFESGTHAGLPFFTLEYVRGGSLEAFARDPLPAADAASLVEGIARGVAHAHAAGIVHRDLKPANVLLKGVRDDGSANATVADGSSAKGAIPKVTDFGLAKLLDGVDGLTATHAVMGTPSYMAPEQARGDAKTVGPAADVYALGAILYRLVTGRPPFTSPSKAGVLEQVIRDEPLSPSGLVPGLPRDIETICLKCLQKEPDRRYATASEVADELRRFGAGDSIRARPPGRTERTVKWVRRNRGPAVVMAVVVAFGGLASWQWGRAATAEADARTQLTRAQLAEAAAVERERSETAARADAEAQKRIAIGKATEAQEQQRTATAVKEFLQTVLEQGDPASQDGPDRRVVRDLTVKQAVAVAARRIEGRFADQPLVEADLRATIGKTYYGLSLFAESAPHFERALALRERAAGPTHVLTLASLNDLAALKISLKDYPAAEALLGRALATAEATVGPNHATTLDLVNTWAGLHTEKGELKAAERLYLRVIAGREKALSPDHPDTLASVNDLAAVYHYTDRIPEAKVLFRRALDGFEKAQGLYHPNTVRCAGQLALLYDARREPEVAGAMLRRAVEGYETAFGPDHPDTLVHTSNLAYFYELTQDYATAARHQRRVLAARERLLGPDDPKTIQSANRMAIILLRADDVTGAEPLFARVLAGWDKTLGPTHRDTLLAAHNLAAVYARTGRGPAAVPLFERYLAGIKKASGPTGRGYGDALVNTAAYLLLAKQFADAERLLRAGLGIREAAQPDAWSTANTRSMLGEAVLRQGRGADAGPLLEAGFAGLKSQAASIPVEVRNLRLREAADRLADWAVSAGHPADAARWRAEASKYPEPLPPPRPVKASP